MNKKYSPLLISFLLLSSCATERVNYQPYNSDYVYKGQIYPGTSATVSYGLDFGQRYGLNYGVKDYMMGSGVDDYSRGYGNVDYGRSGLGPLGYGDYDYQRVLNRVGEIAD